MDFSITSTAKLNNEVEMPWFGLGVYESPRGEATQKAVLWALEAGYRHIDTARVYGNERDVGAAIRDSGMPRSEIFITTKLWNAEHGYTSTLDAFDKSMERLGLDYIDLYLVHWPVENLRLDSWRAMESLLDSGKCRAIGVSNYMIHHLEELLSNSSVTPAVNQFELNPYCYRSRKSVVDFCKQHHIVVESYAPLTKARKLRDPHLMAMAEKYGKTSAQILIRWNLQKEIVVIPKSVKRERIFENAGVFNFSISDQDMSSLDALDENFITSWDPTGAP